MKQISKLHGDAVGGNAMNGEQAAQGTTNQENWRAFGNSETGRLLAKLYGGKYTPQIQYPELKSKKKKTGGSLHSSGWHPTGKTGNVDPRRSHINKSKALSVSVPKFQRKAQSSFAYVDAIPKKRAAQQCKEFIEDVEMRKTAYRPPNINAYSSEGEKERLSEGERERGGRGRLGSTAEQR